MARGDAPAEARSSSTTPHRRLGSVKEACRDMRTLQPVEHFLHDLRFGARLLARGPGFTAVAVPVVGAWHRCEQQRSFR